MAKRDTKRAGGRTRKRKQKALRPTAPTEEGDHTGGFLSGLRGRMQSVAGTGSKAEVRTKSSRFLDVLLWVAVIAALAFFLLRHLS